MVRYFLPILIAFSLAVAVPVWGEDFYVDQNNPGANDRNPGSITQPWKTITKANNTLVAGDTVHIRAGTYKDATI
ncbi:MAG: DUF1565 domain-containing protein, partial [Deltaproteobacteria bacterium]|nr:DUF1565 domain-containing protein [Deltaproteobacteria bacterium]